MTSYITNFKGHSGGYTISQDDAIDWLCRYHGQEFIDQIKKYSVNSSYIASRKTYAPGVADFPFEGPPLYQIDEAEKPILQHRSDIAQKVLQDSIFDFYNDSSNVPDYINHVSCTHYQSPSIAQNFVVEKEWFDKTIVTHLYHMGCYAAIPAIRIGKAFLADGARQVDNIHTELCSFHLDKDNVTPEQIIMKTLFADGIIKYSIVDQKRNQELKTDALEIIHSREVQLPGTGKEMTWKLRSHGFLMSLSRRVPVILAKKIKTYMEQLFAESGLDFDAMKDKVFFAIHPGGPKIVEKIQDVLALDDWQVAHSKHILYTRGNMSSATIPYIWDHLLKDREVQDKRYVVSVAFGPGLTLAGAILRLCRN